MWRGVITVLLKGWQTQLCMCLQVWYFGPNIGHAILGLEPSGCTYLAGEWAACIRPAALVKQPVSGSTPENFIPESFHIASAHTLAC